MPGNDDDNEDSEEKVNSRLLDKKDKMYSRKYRQVEEAGWMITSMKIQIVGSILLIFTATVSYLE